MYFLRFSSSKVYEGNISDTNDNFDIIKFLESDDYKKAAIDYYGLIMGTFNGLDMVTNNPIY